MSTAPLSGTVAVVAGATRGIGKGIALELGAGGAVVYPTGRTLAAPAGGGGSLEETAAEIAALGGTAVPVACDYTDDEAVAALFARVATEQGRLDVLVNCVFDSGRFGSSIGKRFWELPVGIWDEVVDVGTRSAYVASVFAAPLLLASAAGLIVNVSARGASRYRYNVAYGAGKAALDKMTADMALDLRDEGVAVVSLWPNVTRTERVDAAVAEGDAERLAAFGAVDQLETPRFSGRAVVALAADPDRAARSGRAYWVAALGKDYGFTDEHGQTHAVPDEPGPPSVDAATGAPR